MIIHTKTRPGVIGELHAYEHYKGPDPFVPFVWFSIYLLKSENHKWLDFIEVYKLTDALAALEAGMKSGNFDRYRAEERHRRAVENDTLDQY